MANLDIKKFIAELLMGGVFLAGDGDGDFNDLKCGIYQITNDSTASHYMTTNLPHNQDFWGYAVCLIFDPNRKFQIAFLTGQNPGIYYRAYFYSNISPYWSAWEKIMTIETASLSTYTTIYRFGKIRVLNNQGLAPVNLALTTEDRPSKQIVGTGYAAGPSNGGNSNLRIGRLTINTDGSVSCLGAVDYNNSNSGFGALNSTDYLYVTAIWTVN